LSANVDFALGRDVTLTTIEVSGLSSKATLSCKKEGNTYIYNKNTGGFTYEGKEVDTPITIDTIICS
jgi:glucose dehydrogenase